MRALIIIDMQMEMQRRLDAGYNAANPDAPEKIARLAQAFRQAHLPVIHVRHQAKARDSALHKDAPGFPPMACAKALPGEPIFVKTTSSAFASTGLADWLRAEGLSDLVVVGAVAGFCVNSTVRAGCDLGFAMTVVQDAVLGFGFPASGLSADVVLAVTLAHLEADFATLTDTDALLAGL